MAELVGNLLVAQSGGPTAAINASVAGVIQEAGRHDFIAEIYGGRNGILGILNEELIDLNDEKARVIEGIKRTPGAALGTCRYKIDFKNNARQAAQDMDRLFQVFQAHDIRYFFYAGGNDSQDTAQKIHEETVKRGYEVRVIGIPKTIDNDLPLTDHCPGYGSAIKYNATSVMEIGMDIGSMATDEGACCIVEVMGRSTGWIAAGTILAKRHPHDPPHIILLPEVPFQREAFFAKVQEVVQAYNYCIVVAAEGLKASNGEELGADKAEVDPFGHALLSGAAEHLSKLLRDKLNLKTRTVKLGYAQRAAAHFASETDIQESSACGEAAVRAAIDGRSGFMVTLLRQPDGPYKWTTGIEDLANIANAERAVPRDWISEDGFLPNEKFIEFARPLVEGEPKLLFENGVPKFAVLEKNPVEKRLPPRGQENSDGPPQEASLTPA